MLDEKEDKRQVLIDTWWNVNICRKRAEPAELAF